jgi:hypothetical protein
MLALELLVGLAGVWGTNIRCASQETPDLQAGR